MKGRTKGRMKDGAPASAVSGQDRGVRVLTSAVLVTEAIMVALAIPVAVIGEGSPTWVGWALAVLALICVLLPGAYSRRWYRFVGWGVQVAVIASGFWVPMMYVLGLVFAVLWWLAIRVGSKPGQRQPAV